MKTNAEIVALARKRAKEAGKPLPATAADVQRLSGFIYNGPNPRDVGKTFTVSVRRVK